MSKKKSHSHNSRFPGHQPPRPSDEAREKEIADALARAQSPEAMREFEARLDSKPGLRERLQKEADRRLAAFEQALLLGEVRLDLFTNDERGRPFLELERYMHSNGLDVNATDPAQIAERFRAAAQRALTEIATPARLETLAARVRDLALERMRASDPTGALLQVEAGPIASVSPTENAFLWAAYIGETREWQPDDAAPNS